MKWENLAHRESEIGGIIAAALESGMQIKFAPSSREELANVTIHNPATKKTNKVAILEMDTPEAVKFRVDTALENLMPKGKGNAEEAMDEAAEPAPEVQG
jgi:hypothetical protein